MSTARHYRFILQHGLITGLIYITLYLISIYARLYIHVWSGILNYLIPSLYILIVLIRYRPSLPGAILKFSQAYKISFATMLVSTILFTFFTYWYLNYVNPAFIEEQMETVIQSYEEKGLEEEVYKTSLNFTRKMMTNFWLAVPLGIFFGAIINAIICLIIAAIAKKKVKTPSQKPES